MPQVQQPIEMTLRKAVLAHIEGICEEEIEAAKARISQRVKEAAPQIAVALFKRFTVVPYHDRLTIEIKLDDQTKGHE